MCWLLRVYDLEMESGSKLDKGLDIGKSLNFMQLAI
jgi:hypothetical protein